MRETFWKEVSIRRWMKYEVGEVDEGERRRGEWRGLK